MPKTFALLLLVAITAAIMIALPATSAQGPTPTADPYAALTIDALTARPYGGGVITVQQVMADADGFTRYLIAYPSDGLTIYGFMNVPDGAGPFPVVIALHGYIDPAEYGTLDYTTPYADALARAGFLVLHPNLRGYWPSDDGPNLLRVGMAIDALNLIALVRQTGGQPGTLQTARPDSIGLWGHSMGGGITLRVITISADVRAAVLYGAMSGDERQNFAKIMEWSGGERGRAESAVPDDALREISPIHHLDRIQAAVSIHHGGTDELVPVEWSVNLCARLTQLGKAADCFLYSGQPHTFSGDGSQELIRRTIGFFSVYLLTPT